MQIQRIKKITKTLSICLFAYLLIFICIPPAHAQQIVRTITIVPPTVEQIIDPGKRAEGQLKVINDGPESITFTASVQDFIVDNKGGSPNLLPPNTLSNKYSASSWIGIYPDSFTVGPHQKELLNYYIQIPPDARPGGHYAAVIYQPSNLLGVGGNTGAGVNTYIGSLFYITVTGPVHEQAKVTAFTGGGFYENGPVKITTEIANLGDLHIHPLGVITIYDIFHREVTSLPLSEYNIFPGAARDYATLFGQYWMLGPFTAQLSAKYGEHGNLELVATTTFWVFPWKVAIVVVLIIIAAVLGFLLWKRKTTTPENTDDKEAPVKKEEKDKEVKE